MEERGDIILHGLLRIVAGLVLSAVLVFEGGAVAVNRLHVEGAAQSAARAGAQVWEAHRDRARAEAAVHASAADLYGAAVTELSVESDGVVVTVSRRPPVLLLDRIALLEERIAANATARAPVDR